MHQTRTALSAISNHRRVRSGVIQRVIATAALMVVGSCGDPSGPEMSALDRAQAKFNRLGLTVYTLEQYRDCFCADHNVLYRVMVVQGQVASALNTNTGAEVPAEQLGWLRSVPQLFADIREALKTRDATVDVEYDPVTGVPTRVWIDPSPRIADEEFGFRTANIRPLTP